MAELTFDQASNLDDNNENVEERAADDLEKKQEQESFGSWEFLALASKI